MRWALTHPLGVVAATGGARLAGLPERFVAPATGVLAAVASDSSGPDRGRESAHGLRERVLQPAARGASARVPAPRGGARGRRISRAGGVSPAPFSVSSSPSLADLGEGLAETLRAEPATAEAPWLVDLAQLERAAAEVWLSDTVSAPGPIRRWRTARGRRLALVPEARELRLGWDVTDWDPENGPPARRDAWLVMWRVEGSTEAEWVDPAPGAVLDALVAGISLGTACELAGSLGMSAGEVTQSFGHWTGRGWLIPRRTGT